MQAKASQSFTINFSDISGTPRDLNVYTATSGTAGSSQCCAHKAALWWVNDDVWLKTGRRTTLSSTP